MKTLIIGSTGFLGREVMRVFASAGAAIAVSRHGANGSRAIDIRNANELRALVDDTAPDVVLLLAAYRDPDFCESDPIETRRLNVEPARVLRECLPRETRLLFVSTDYVFDGEHPPYTESSPRMPVNEYGRSKAEAEDVLAGRPNTTILRVPLLVGGGPSLRESGFVGILIEEARRERPIEVDNVLIRVPTWTRDVAHAMRFLVERRADGVFHFSGPRGATRYAWTVEIAELLGYPSRQFIPSQQIIPRRARRPRDSSLDDSKIRALGFDRRTDFLDVVRIVLAEMAESQVT
jgi:dTDP-4-dehydrorhamnose reductase